MLFNSIEYLLFLPIIFAVYWSLNKYLVWQNILLLCSSYLFYALWDYRFLSLIIASSLADFLIGIQLDKQKSKTTRKALLGLSLFINLGFLLVFKYYNFFIDSFSDLIGLFGFSLNLTTLNIILPVGISFYTFQTLSYTIDIYKKKFTSTKNILNFFTYVAFFPQLVAGPIERAYRLLPQLESSRSFNFIQSRDGLRQILWGLFKKVVVADNCAIFADHIFNNYEQFGSLNLILGAFLFTIQIYCDFSGYSDIAIGTARILGINLMQNFSTPYFSRDIAEFWRRWHISLTTWFRDYVYIPLGGSRVSQILQLRNIFAIFLISGFWHGANWTYIVWGMIHATCYIPQVLLKTNRKFLDTISKNKIMPSIVDLVRILRTFSIITITFIFFRTPNVADSFQYLTNIISFKKSHFIDFSKIKDSNVDDLWLLFIFICVLFTTEWANRKGQHGLEKLPSNKFIRYIIYLILCLLILEYFYGERVFIYFQF